MTHATDKHPVPPMPVSVGARIRAVRKARGWMQHGLAQRAGLSVSTISKVESGHLAASPLVTAACARALRVSVTDLTGQPYMDALKADELEILVQPLRQAIANPLLPGEDIEPREPASIRADIARLDATRLRGEYMAIGAEAPALIDELLVVVDRLPEGREREAAYRLLADAYRLARSFVGKLGFTDLSLLALDRMQQTIPHSGDPYLHTAVVYYRSEYFLHHGFPEIALREIGRVEGTLDEPVRRGDPQAASVRGALYLKSAVLHSRTRKPGAAGEVAARIGEARELADRLPGPDAYGLIFDSTNVELHAASTQLDLGEVGRMVEMGERIRMPAGWVRNREGHHHMDMGRAYELVGRRGDALAALERARRTAPAQTRYHPTTRETVHALLRARGTPSAELRGYARWIGV
ncbi:helix-turn-helix domain-containing protein [Streptomyces alkaliphilus]|uniref:Helix-turn-helix domain-containing protein n=2 Tax=Streptomyces alkaliphilus TaxID=1472722 RepID=A0A7W3TDD6_9ACTN|nr:helix-turn-helix domain-containing protein [Streptomyces alkaliphilus]